MSPRFYFFPRWKTNKKSNLFECVSVKAAFCKLKPPFLHSRFKRLQMKLTRTFHPFFCFSRCFSLLPAAAHLFLVLFFFFSSPSHPLKARGFVILSNRQRHLNVPALTLAPSLSLHSRKTSQFSSPSAPACKTRHLSC